MEIFDIEVGFKNVWSHRHIKNNGFSLLLEIFQSKKLLFNFIQHLFFIYIQNGILWIVCVTEQIVEWNFVKFRKIFPPGSPGLPGSIRRLHCHGWPSAGEKSLKLINTPSHSPNDGQASPCLNSHSSHIPILIACSILCLSLPHHCPIHAPNPQISDLSFRSWQVWVHAFP